MSAVRRIGPFEIEGPLHEGGMGTLYLARDVERGVRVVLKISRQSDRKSPEDRALYEEALQGEAEILRDLHHPHIVRLYPIRISEGGERDRRVVYTRRAVDLPGQPWYFAMEFLGGGSLEQLLKARGPLPLDVAVEIGYQVAMALEYLHGRGIAHRDIKPQNILFRRPIHEGIEAVLVDFGLAQRHRARGLEAGTLLYMPPEQVELEKGGAPPADPRPGDVYALGVVLYRMVTGRLPFEGRSRDQLTSAIRKTMPTRPSLIRKDIPPPLDDLILEMMAKEPERRPTAAWVARRLNEAIPWHQRFLEQGGEERGSKSPPRPERSSRSVVQTILIIGLLALATAGWGLYLADQIAGSSVSARQMASPSTPTAVVTATPLVMMGGGGSTPTRPPVVNPTATPRPTRTPTPTIPPPPSPSPTSGP